MPYFQSMNITPSIYWTSFVGGHSVTVKSQRGTAMAASKAIVQVAEGQVDQLLAWVAFQPRSYGEAMDVWVAFCPMLTPWEDATAEGLVRVIPTGRGMAAGAVTLTEAGAKRLAGLH